MNERKSRARRAPTGNVADHLYAIEAPHLAAGGLRIVKIGRSKNVAMRLNALASGLPFDVHLLGSADGRGPEEIDFHRCFHSRLITVGRSREWFALSDADIASLLTWDLDKCNIQPFELTWESADLYRFSPRTESAAIAIENLRSIACRLASIERSYGSSPTQYVSRKTIAYELKSRLGFRRVEDADEVLDAIESLMSALAEERVSLFPLDEDDDAGAALVRIADMAAKLQGRTSFLKASHWSDQPNANRTDSVAKVLRLASELECSAMIAIEKLTATTPRCD